ncbi:FecR domain-containing protein [Pseudomonas sp. ABC1]|uniref:FecR domain-containing protein n=1 Tax=Pseudomonas sp. ABC1 TaxID=2748080 RepID=UPI0015C3CC70|nr:FecR domain-containing protein [Pseudomonas sp. ABC1]QLF93323.1 FecR domain-containing protein [Pseudomonas sp. ABC1]
MRNALGQAVEWHVRLHDSQADATDQAAWQTWLEADPRHAEAWQRLERLQRRMHGVPAELALPALEQAGQRRRSLLKGLALFAGLGTLGWQGYRLSPLSVDHSTAVGQRLSLTLADGSRLELNTETRVNIRFDAGQRLVHLLAGEIFVETAHDPRPFKVQTAQGETLALGTRFSVRQQDGLTRVAVEQHAVEVRPRLAPGQVQRLEAGQQMTFSAERLGTLQAAPDDASAWTRGLLVVIDWRLGDFIEELSRYRPGYLGCAEAVAGLRVSGAFLLDDSDAVLANLQASLPVEVRRFSRYWARIEALPGG